MISYHFRKLGEVIMNVAEQVVKEVNECSEEHGLGIDKTTKRLLRGQILEIVKDDHKIRSLVCEYSLSTA